MGFSKGFFFDLLCDETFVPYLTATAEPVVVVGSRDTYEVLAATTAVGPNSEKITHGIYAYIPDRR